MYDYRFHDLFPETFLEYFRRALQRNVFGAFRTPNTRKGNRMSWAEKKKNFYDGKIFIDAKKINNDTPLDQ